VFGNKELEDELEQDYWTVRMAKQAALDMSFYGRVGEGNLDSILMMGMKQQHKVLKLATHFHLQLDQGMALLKDKSMGSLMTTNNENQGKLEEGNSSVNLLKGFEENQNG